MQQLSTANVLARMAPTERMRVHEALFETETLSPEALRERIATLIAAGRDGYYEALIRTLGSSNVGRVLDGNGAPSLLASVEQYRSPHGLLFTAATDKGIKYPKDRNEDRVVLRPDVGFTAVIDGIGGETGSEQFAALLATCLAERPDDMDNAMTLMREKLAEKPQDGSACFAAVKTWHDDEGQLFLTGWRAGDVRIAVVDPDGAVRYESSDETLANALYNANILSIRKEAKNLDDENKELLASLRLQQLKAMDQQLNNSGTRSAVSNFVDRTACKTPAPVLPAIKLKPGSIILLMSDGITDNLLTHEIIHNCRTPLRSDDILETIDRLTTTRMENFEKIVETAKQRIVGALHSDGFAQPAKRDNRGIAIIEVPR